MDRDQFFGNLFNENSENADAIRVQRQLAFEERTIKRVFTECGAKRAAWGRLANECRDMTGQNNLNFRWFNAVYREFPAVLCGKRIPRLHELTFSDIFKNTARGKNRLCSAVLKSLERLEVNPEHGFVFVFPVVRTMFCAHTLMTDNVKDQTRIQWSWQLGRTMLIVEPTVSLFGSIGPEWAVTDE